MEESFEYIHPNPVLAPFIRHYWMLKTGGESSVKERTLPTGTVNLVFHRGGRMFSSVKNALQPRFFICGQTYDYTDLTSEENVDMLVVVFEPCGAKAFFSIPVDEFFGEELSFADLNDRALCELSDRLYYSTDNRHSVDLIEQYLLKRLRLSDEYNFRRMNAAIGAIKLQNNINVSGLSEVCCLSSKQFNRIFSDYVGANPKEYLRIVRFQRALYTLQTKSGISLTELTHECAYYDQPHLIKDFRVFSGYTPGEFLSLCAPYSDYFSEP